MPEVAVVNNGYKVTSEFVPVIVTAEATAAVPVISEEMVFGSLASGTVPAFKLLAFR